ncbi:647_t:CDS:2 [Dentiscutata heterogama]|uniref:647_t:CDS:1 n=1 Tax=Dentiscutata heterogama TaxID=1316150 RepID=A0ACA9KQ58_9GLOM|nr:647_t:CDS:2 [Dentiscutata heterogama]
MKLFFVDSKNIILPEPQIVTIPQQPPPLKKKRTTTNSNTNTTIANHFPPLALFFTS